MPASSAMRLVRAPANPLSRNTFRAASTMISRRSSAPSRVRFGFTCSIGRLYAAGNVRAVDDDEQPPPRKRLSAEARRRLIIDAARDVFLENGEAGARLRDIADRAGITEAYLYRYFSS